MNITALLCCTLLGIHVSVFAEVHEIHGETKTNATALNSSPLDTNITLQSEINPIHDAPVSEPEPICECGVFNASPNEFNFPIMSHFRRGVSCDSAGQEKCLQICSALVDAAEDYGPRLLCASLGYYSHLMVTVHSRVCGSKRWLYTGLSSPPELCCHEYQVVDCSKMGNLLQ